MSARFTTWLACGTVVVVALVGGADALLMRTNHSWRFGEALVRVLTPLVFVAVGALIVTRRSRNRIGWLFCCVSLLIASGMCAIETAVYALWTAPGTLPGGVWFAMYGVGARDTGFFAVLTFLPLIFPTGQLVSSRWRVVAWSAVSVQVLFVVSTVVTQFSKSLDARIAGIPNPLSPFSLPVSGVIQDTLFVALLASCIVCGTSLFARFRRSRQVERQQLKWLLYAVTLSLILAGVVWAILLAGVRDALPTSVWLLLIISLPIGTAIAILRYRLYDIDLIINRTLVYGSLTAVLAAVYFGCVFMAQTLGQAVTGQTRPQPVIIVASTLLIATLFNPLRRRIQTGIDRRFYRAKYDAARTLEAFAASLRAETDLRGLGERLVGVVRETMQPAQVRLWLREPSNAMRDERGASPPREHAYEGGQP